MTSTLATDGGCGATMAGRIPCLRAGRRLLFDADAVERALIQRAAQSPQKEGTDAK